MRVDQVAAAIETHLTQIKHLFKDAKLTIIARSPDHPDSELILSDDNDFAAVVALLRKHMKGKT